MTLIAVYNSDGCAGRCDARCYDANSADCDCICGGANHGKGFDVAISNTQERFDEWIAEYSQQNNLGPEFKWDVPGAQMSFGLGV